MFTIRHRKYQSQVRYNQTLIYGIARRYTLGHLPPNYPVPAIRHDVCYWDCGGISISVPGECNPRYTFGRTFGHGVRINYWEP